MERGMAEKKQYAKKRIMLSFFARLTQRIRVWCAYKKTTEVSLWDAGESPHLNQTPG